MDMKSEGRTIREQQHRLIELDEEMRKWRTFVGYYKAKHENEMDIAKAKLRRYKSKVNRKILIIASGFSSFFFALGVFIGSMLWS